MAAVVIVGRLGQDPTQKDLDAGTVTEFSVYERKRNKENEFYEVSVWGKAGKFVMDYFQKGKSILIAGNLEPDHWEDDNGNKRMKNKIHATTVNFVPQDQNAEDDSEDPPF